jgi:hypothetical protein
MGVADYVVNANPIKPVISGASASRAPHANPAAAAYNADPMAAAAIVVFARTVKSVTAPDSAFPLMDAPLIV